MNARKAAGMSNVSGSWSHWYWRPSMIATTERGGLFRGESRREPVTPFAAEHRGQGLAHAAVAEPEVVGGGVVAR